MKLFSVPSEQGNLDKNKGCGKAPPAILKDRDFETVEIVEGNFEETDNAIYEKAAQVLKESRAFFVGGDHSISYALVKAFAETASEKRAVVVFDAHPDCVQFFKPLSHEDWVQGIIEEGLVKAENVLLIGIRKSDKLETEYVKKSGIEVVGALEVKSKREQAMDRLLKLVALNKEIYVSVDIDVFDPKIAPGTGYLEKNGLSWEEFAPLFEAIIKSGKVKAVDLVEVNPSKDLDGKTVGLAKKVLETALRE